MNANRKRRIRQSVYVIAPVAAILAGFLMFRGCDKPQPAAAREALFVPRDLARLKGLDAEGVLAYCRDEIRTSDYGGVQRGAHGALWAGEGNAWDKALLAAAALDGKGIEARVVPGDKPHVAVRGPNGWAVWRLDAAAPDETVPQPPAGAITPTELAASRPELFHTLTPVLVLERDGQPPERIKPASTERLADWSHQAVVIETRDSGYVVRVGQREILRSLALADVKRASLELTWNFQDKSASWTRELFDRDNGRAGNVGPGGPKVGERFVLAVASGPLKPEVLATRRRMMELDDYEPQPDEAVRQLVNMAVKYQVDSDERTNALARECEVAVNWVKPRVTVAAGNDKDLTLDLLADEVEAAGPRSREFHVARGLANDLIETRLIYEATRQPTVSASTILSHLKSDRADSPDRRAAAIEKEVRRMLANEPLGSATVFVASPHPALSEEDRKPLPQVPPRLAVERTAEGVAIRGLVKKGEAPKDEPWKAYDWQEDGSVAFANVTELAHVLDGMMCRKMGRLDHMLECRTESAWPLRPLPVVAGSVLTYRARVKDKESRLTVKLSLKDGATVAAWSEDGTDRRGEATGGWPEVLAAGPQLRAIVAPSAPAGESARQKVRVGLNEREVVGQKVAIPGGEATVLAAAHFPLVLAWKKGDLSLTLEAASPSVFGQVRDADSERPVAADVIQAHTVITTENAPIDLRKWKQQGPTQNGKWKVASDGASVEQSLNGDPTFFVSPDEYIDTTIRGKLSVTDPDDDYIGFVFGYQSPLREKGHKDNDFEFMLFDWKCADQGPAKEGFSLARVHGNFDDREEGEYPGFWSHKSQSRFDILATDFGKDKGWRHKKEHEFELTYTRTQVKIAVDGKLVFDVKGAFRPGRFGFFNYSQADVKYQGFSTLMRRKVQVEFARASTAIDGSYAVPAAARGERLLLVLDRSGSMQFSLDPKAEFRKREPPAPIGEQRIDHLRNAVNKLLDRVPSTAEVAVWSFASDRLNRGNDDSPIHVRVDCPYTTDHARVRRALQEIKPGGGTPLSGTVTRILDHLREEGAAGTTVVLLTDGVNTGKVAPAAAYKLANGRTPIHSIGFAIEPKSKAEQDLRDLAEVSHGSFRIAGTGEQLTVAFGEFAKLPNAHLRFETSCYAPAEVEVPASELGVERRDVWLSHGCAGCQCVDKSLLTITKGTVAKLAECRGLSPKARKLIEERVADGKWSVVIPDRRVDVGPVAVYGWWESETATGRMIGRTEDGLHGSSPAGANWAGTASAGALPFVAWFHGLTAYTTGSVLAAMDYHNSPGFLSGGHDGFVRFVQANALEFCSRWWDDVGAGAFPENMHSYWSGVCMTFSLQSMATGMPSLDCHRSWAKAMCNQASGAMKNMPKDAFKQKFGADYDDLTKKVKKFEAMARDAGAPASSTDDIKQFLDTLQQMEDSWNQGVDQAFDCARFNRPARGGARTE